MTVETRVEHPLDPLTPQEIEAAASIVRADPRAGGALRFVSIDLREPPKADVVGWTAGDPLDRRATVVAHLRDVRTVVRAEVALADGAVVAWTPRTDAQAPLTVTELLQCEEAVRADERWQAAMRARGIEDLALAMVDPWPTGYNGEDDDPGRGRTLRPLTWMRRFEGDNGYARPVEGLVVRFSLDEMRVLDVEDHGITPLPEFDGNYSEAAISRAGELPALPGRAAARRQAARDRPARGAELRARRQRAALAEVVAARRLQLPRGHRPAPDRLRGQGPRAADRAPGVARRDVRPLRRRRPDPLPQERLRPRRVRRRHLDELAAPRLRLPRRDRLPRRPHQRRGRPRRRGSRTRSASTRRTSAWPGSTRTSARARSRRGGCGGS